MAAPVIASSSPGALSASNSTTITITKPTGLAVDDLLVLHYLYANSSAPSSINLPSGFTIPTNGQVAWRSASSAGSLIATKVADAADVAASNFTVTTTGGTKYVGKGWLDRITGVDTTAPVNIASNQTTTSGTTGNFPTATTTVADCLVLIQGTYYTPGTPSGTQWPFEAPTSTTLGGNANDAPNLVWFAEAYFTQSSAGATGAKTKSCAQTFTSGDDFQAVTVAIAPGAGTQTLSPPLLTNTSVLYAPTVTPGSVTLSPPVLTNTSTLYAPTVTQGTQTLDVPLLANTSSLYAPVITPGSVTVSPPLLTNTSTLYAPTVTVGSVTLSPPLLANSSTLYAPTVTPGSVSLAAPLLTNASVLYPPAVSVPGGSQSLSVPLLTNVSILYPPAANQNDPPGTYPLAIDGGGSVVRGSISGGGSVVAGSISSTGRVVAGFLRGRP